MTQVDDSFGVRFGYLRWLWFLRDGDAPTFKAIGDAVGRTGPAVGAWLRTHDAPTDYRIHRPLLDFFDLKDGDWLIEGRGFAPNPELWIFWTKARRLDLRPAPKGAFRQITRADVDAAKKKGGRRA